MKGIDLKEFRIVNNLTQTELGDYLGVLKGFISKIENEKEKLPEPKFRKLLENPFGWDTSMLTKSEVATEVKPVAESSLVGYLERKVTDQDALIRELYQQIGALEKELELARKGEIASIVATYSDVNVG
jgi:transcriptional regulator with XRE-family HTH domain